jgi:hypothetical protein
VKHLLSIVAISVLLPACSTTGQRSDSNVAHTTAVALVRLAKADELAVVGLKLVAKRSLVNGKISSGAYDCLALADKADYTNMIAAVYAEHLSPSDMSNAIGFFQSTAGQKYTEINLIRLNRVLELSLGGKEPNVSKQETDEIQRFMVSAVTDPQSQTGVAVNNTVRQPLLDLLKKCGAIN